MSKNQLQTKIDYREVQEHELPEVGEWFWLKVDEEDYDEYELKTRKCYWKGYEELVIVEHIASNHIQVGYITDRKRTRSWDRIGFDDFNERAKPAPDAKEYLESRVKGCHDKIEQLTARLARIVDSFKLLPNNSNPDTYLPSETIVDLNKLKNELVVAKEDTIPKIQEEIKEESTNLGVFMNAMTYPLQVKSEVYNEITRDIDSKIFTVQLYAGIHEEVKYLKKGKASDMEEPISVRQTLLYMDEECLLDLDNGGLDIQGLNAFDRWVVEDRNLNRILPEQKSIVAFQVRRKPKDYGPITSIANALKSMDLNEANSWTYLLIRNGENVCRLVTGIDFRPNLFPTHEQMSKEELFKKKSVWSDEKDRIITPDDFDYDDQVEKVQRKITHYKRVMLILQGLVDRTTIFKPIPKIRLDNQEHFEKWVRLIRDSENVIDSKVPSFEEFQTVLNKKIKKGHYVSIVDYDELKHDYPDKWKHGRDCSYSWSTLPKIPKYVQVEGVKRDKSKVKIVWTNEDEVWDRWDGIRDSKFKYHHLWVKMERVLNVTDYEKGSVKRFFENRTIREKYLEWAPALIKAEKFDVNRTESIV